jgi:hypothetical protein
MFIPNYNVSTLADDYLKTADLCVDHDLHKPAIINAALSCELYLKSFSATPVHTEHATESPTPSFYYIHTKTDYGHKLIDDLYKKIPIELKRMIKKESYSINHDFDLEGQLKKYNDTFMTSRYSHELGSTMAAITNYDIVLLAKHLQSIVKKVAEHQHPPVI